MIRLILLLRFIISYDYFIDTFKSVVDQTHIDFEWIIVDNGSDDLEVKKLRLLVESDYHRIRLIEIDYRCGAGIARNAVPEFVCFSFNQFVSVCHL